MSSHHGPIRYGTCEICHRENVRIVSYGRCGRCVDRFRKGIPMDIKIEIPKGLVAMRCSKCRLEHMVPITNEEYLCEECRNNKPQELIFAQDNWV